MADYVTPGTVGHVICEWAVPLTAPTLDGERYHTKVTGLVMTGKGPSVTPERRVYGFRATRTLSFDTLPHGAHDRIYLNAYDYIDAVRDLADAPANLYHDKAIGDRWKQWLRDERIDPDLIRIQANMNAEESGASSLMAENSDAWTFTEKVLTLTADDHAAVTLDAVATLHAKAQQSAGRRRELMAFEALIEPLTEAALLLLEQTECRETLDGVVVTASRLAAGLTEAAAARRRQAEIFGQQVKAAERRLVAAETARDQWARRRTWAERVRQTFKVDAARHDVARASDDLDAAAAAAKAWHTVDAVLAYRIARARVTRLANDIRSAHAAAAPFQERLDARHDEAVATIDHLVGDFRRQAAQATKIADAAEQRIAEIDNALRGLAAADARADAEADAASAELAALEAAIAGRRAAGDLDDRGVGEQEREIRTRRDGIAGREERLDVQLDGLVEAERRLRTTFETATQALTKATATRDRAREHLLRITQAVAAAAATPGFEEIADEATCLDDLDAARNAAANRASDAGTRRRQAEDELRGLRAERRRLDGRVLVDDDVRRAVTSLRTHAVNASSGWEFIADAPPDDRTALVRRRPDLANGIVVTGAAPDDASARIDDVTVDRAIVITGPPDLDHSRAADPAHAVLIPPAHRYDPDVASARRAHLDGWIEHAEHVVEDEGAAERRWSSLATVLDGLTDLPAERAEQVTIAEDAETEILRLEREAERAARDLDANRVEQSDTKTELEGLTRRWRSLTAILEWLTPLAARADRGAAWRKCVDDAEARKTANQVARGDLQREHATVRTTSREQTARAAELRTSAERLREDARSRHIDLDRDVAPIDVNNMVPIARLYESIDELRRKVRENSPDDDLIAEHETAADELTTQQGKLEGLDDGIRQLAERFAGSADAQDRVRRRSRIADADTTEQRAATALGDAQARLQVETKTLDALAPGEQPTEQYPLPTPTTAAKADAVFATVDERHQQAIKEGNDARTAKQDADRNLTEATRDADGYAHAADALTNTLDDRGLTRAPLAETSAFVGTVDDAREQTDDVRSRLRDAAGALAVATEAADHGVGVVIEILDSSEAMPDTLAGQIRLAVGVGHRDLPEVTDQVRQRIRILTDELGSFDTERDQLVQQIARAAASTLSLLDKLAGLSTMRGDLGEWTGRQFIKVTYSREVKKDLVTPTGRVLDELLESDREPDDLQALLIAILQAALGDRGLRVQMLKPTSELSYVYNDLDAFRASDGQRLTAAILLYCVLSRVRSDAVATGRHGPGALWLDNPFGKANQVTLVDLQRKMADALGVQLIYCTGIDDPNAVAHLDRWNHLVPKLNRASGNRHLVNTTIGRTNAQIESFKEYRGVEVVG